MADYNMEEVATALLSTLKKPTAPIESKLTQFNTFKSVIKHQRVPESAQATTVECIRLAIASQTNSQLVTAGLSSLTHLIKRLALQEQMSPIFTHKAGLIPVLLERLGDAKESYRTSALQSFCDLYPTRSNEVEKVIRDGAILGSNPRAKEAGMQWVAMMHNEHNLQFRAFVGPMVECLEDADGHIREAAKTNLVELFSTASNRAKADLKRQLIAHNVRKSIATYILSQLQIQGPGPTDLGSSTQSAMPQHEPPRQDQVYGIADVAPHDVVLPPSAEVTHIEPLYVESSRELERMFEEMLSCFEGRESEQNWMVRDKNVLKLRRLNQGNAPSECYTAFVGGIKHLLDGILKVANSLRTTTSTNGCELVQELARSLGSGLDSMVELLLQSFVKMCSATKNIAAQNGNTTCDILFSNVSYNARLLQHISQATQEKNAQPRIFAAGWLKTIIRKHGHNKSHYEHAGGLEHTIQSIKKGLSDANPKVREGMRSTFWVFASFWPEKGEGIMSTLDAKSRQLLEKDPGNPNAASANGLTSSVGPSGAANPRAAASHKSSSASLKETIAAQKKAALMAKKYPDRPNSAMAILSPAKPERTPGGRIPSSNLSSSTRPPQPSTSRTAARAAPTTSSSNNQGTLMSAPMRRPRKVEMQRPATADPYANQKLLRAETPPTGSPSGTPVRPVFKPSTVTSHTKSKSTTATMYAPVDSQQSSRASSPHVSPSKTGPKNVQSPNSQHTPPRFGYYGGSPRARDNNTTAVASDSKSPQRQGFVPFKSGNDYDRPASGDSSIPGMMEEDNFTMVMPTRSGFIASQPTQSSQPSQSSPWTGPSSPQRMKKSSGAPVEFAKSLDIDLDRASAVTMEATQGGQEPVVIYEDPESGQPSNMEAEKMVLEELPPSQQNVAQGPDIGPDNERPRSISPSKRSRPGTPGDATQDRAEVLKSRRLLASGIERIRAKAIDAHGFRRLQDVVKTNTPISDSQQYTEVVKALLEYLNAPTESLKVAPFKAQSLKSQALGIIRGVLVIHQRDDAIKAAYPRALCGVVAAKKTCDASYSHLAADLDKAADEIVKHARSQVTPCIDALLTLAEHENDAAPLPGPHRSITMALNVLSKLLGQQKGRQESPSAKQKQRMGRLAVRFLDNTDADVRRADTEFCLELHGAFGEGEEGKREFWRALEGARETQLNLVAYYLAKRGRGA